MISLIPRKDIPLALTVMTPIIAIALTLIVGAIIFATLGYDPLQALYQFFIAPVSRPDQLGENDSDVIEAEGIRRALQKAENADVKILLYDGGKKEPDPYTLSMIDENVIKVVSKADQKIIFEYPAPLIEISSKTGQGFDILLKTIQDKIIQIAGQGRDAPSLTRMRHRNALHECLAALNRSKEAALPELMAEDVRLAIRSIGQITGRVDVEDLLDVIFRDFCIGK